MVLGLYNLSKHLSHKRRLRGTLLPNARTLGLTSRRGQVRVGGVLLTVVLKQPMGPLAGDDSHLAKTAGA